MTKPINTGASPFKDPKVEKFIINLQKAFGTFDVKKHEALLKHLRNRTA